MEISSSLDSQLCSLLYFQFSIYPFFFFFFKLPEVFCGFPLLEDETKSFYLFLKGTAASLDYCL